MEVLSGGAFLSPTFERLLQKLDCGLNSLDLHEEAHTALQKWKSFFPQICAVLNDAERKQMTDISVKTWLDDLKDLAYDMEDILDQFKVDVQMRNMNERPNQASTSKFTLKCFSCFGHNNFVDSNTVSKAMGIAMRLQSMEERSMTLKLLSSKIQQIERPETATARRMFTTSLPDSHVYGLETAKAAILQKLLNDDGSSEHEGFCVLPIVGMGGIGKTTLARLVYNEVGPENFELKVWVCVSEEFDVRGITRHILEASTGDRCDWNDLNMLQEKLKEKLFDKKFLLVLDDVWNEEYALWDILRVPFKSGAPGSKIIITTREMHVAQIMDGKDAVYQLELPKEDVCLSILAQAALGEENFDAHPSLKEVGEKIARRCKRLPLAAKILGGLLRGKEHLDDWEHLLNHESFDLPDGNSDILSALRLSYHHLPSYLKQCFAYLAVFPKDHQFSKEEVIFLWMAEGLLQPPEGRVNQMEDLGNHYFHELLSCSFFQSSSKNLSQYVMHDLIHDLAQHVAGETFYNLEHWLEAERSEVNYEKVRYLSFHREEFDISKKFEVLNKMKSLRTFIHSDSSSPVCYLSNTVQDWLVELRCLRVLSFQYCQIRNLPDSIENLKCLRYLNLSESRIESLPESIGFLLSLQILMLHGCRMFSKFPAAIGNLIDLHHLDITNTPSLKAMPQVIANLTELLTLPKFIVGKANGLRLSDMRNLFHLQGHLSILELQNVCNIQDAILANLHMKDGLDELVLQWTSDFDNYFRDGSNVEMEVLSSLRPHLKLKKFTISCYGGEQFPSWIGDPLRSLSHLKLSSCRRSTLLPPLGQLVSLKELIIEDMDAIEVVDSEFYHGNFISLQTLKFHNMLNWEEWDFPTATGVEFPCLVDLEITNCPKLVGKLPSHLSSLVNLVISGCRKLTCSSISLPSLRKLCLADCEQVLLKSMVYLTSLTTLQLEDISGLCCLPKSFTESLAALETLRIERCLELKCLWKEGVDGKKLTCLRSMTITWCPELVSLTSQEQDLLPSSLKYLKLSNCKNLKSLPDGIMVKTDGSNSSNMLGWLIIRDCPYLERFPSGKLPTTLNRLEIVGCTNAGYLPGGIFDNSNTEDLLITKLESLKFFHDNQLPAALKHFEIRDCRSLESISEMMLQQCTGLKWMEIWDCVNLKSLSFSCLPRLTRLCIERCDAIESFQEMPELSLCIPNIQYLKIESCQNLKFLPNKIYNLKSIEELLVGGCPGIKSIPEGGLPLNLTVLSIDCENLKQHMRDWGLHGLTSLDFLQVGSICPPKNVLPSSLTTLWIKGVPNLKSIPKGLLQSLKSLKEFRILGCPNLQFLPRKGLPPLLGQLRISECPLLNPETFQEKGDNWPVIAHIPLVKINGIQITPL